MPGVDHAHDDPKLRVLIEIECMEVDVKRVLGLLFVCHGEIREPEKLRDRVTVCRVGESDAYHRLSRICPSLGNLKRSHWMQDEQRSVRAARNESLFRGLNERLEDVHGGTRPSEPTAYFCECSNRNCANTVELLPDEYERVRAEGDRFFVLPGHLTPAVERILEQHATYWIVEKVGIGGSVAEALDPRG